MASILQELRRFLPEKRLRSRQICTVNDALNVPEFVPPSEEDMEAMRLYFAQNTLTLADVLVDCDYCEQPIYGAGVDSGGFYEDGLKFHDRQCRDNHMERAQERAHDRGF